MSEVKATTKRGRPRKVAEISEVLEEKTKNTKPKAKSYSKASTKVKKESLQGLANLNWFHLLAKIIVLITALVLSLIWRDYRLTDFGTSVVLLLLGFCFIALIISCLSYLMALLLEDKKMLDNSIKLMEFFLDSVICVLLYLIAMHIRNNWLYAGVMIMISYTVLSQDKKKVYLSYMVALLAIFVYCIIGA